MMSSATTGLHAAVFEQARANPQAIALICSDRTLSYDELAEEALRWSALLREISPNRKISVGILSERNHVACTAILAILAAGMTFVPMNVRHPAATLKRLAADAGLEAMIVGVESIPLATTVLSAVPIPLLLIPEGDCGVAPQADAMVFTREDLKCASIEPPVSAPLDDIAYILFTSGSTGIPKGVPVRHESVLAFLDAAQSRYAIGPKDRLTQLFDHSFDLALFDLFMAWRHGAAVCLMDSAAGDNLCDKLRTSEISIWFSVPSVAARLKSAGTLLSNCMPGLRLSLFCGEPLYFDVAEAWHKAAPGSIIENLYGPTELTLACASHRLSFMSNTQEEVGIVPIGTIYPHLPWQIIDQEGVEVCEGALGELCVGGVQMFEGYWRVPELNNGRFVKSKDGTRLYRTGDLVFSRNGLLHFSGRRDNQIKLNGYRIELGQIEVAFRQAGAEDAMALAWPDHMAPKSIRALVSGKVLKEDLATRVAALLPSYMMPTGITSVDALPYNHNGKLDRTAARQLLSVAIVDAERSTSDVDGVISEALDLPLAEIDDDLAIYSSKAWDSLGHARLMLALEEHLGMTINEDLANRLRSVRDIRSIAQQRFLRSQTEAPCEPIRKGLVGVVMDRTKISEIDGHNGSLAYRGYGIEDLCDNSSFEDVVHLLIDGDLPKENERLRVCSAFADAQCLDDNLHALVRHVASVHPTRVLSIAVAAENCDDPYRMVGRTAALLGAVRAARARTQFSPIHHGSHEYRCFHYIFGREPDPCEMFFLRQDMILHAEHGANASTLALRTAISAGTSLSDGVASAILTFSGARHGRAVEAAAQMFDTIGDPKAALAYVEQNPRVMGFGHRIYKTGDPRALRIRGLAAKMAQTRGNHRDLEIADALVEAMSPRTRMGVAPNIDLYAAVAYRLMGLPDDLGTAVAITGRIAGWCAHAIEQAANNVLIRPDFLYDGPHGRSVRPQRNG